MVSAEAAIDIDAPIDVVWGVVLDLASYGAWNPFVVGVENAPARPSVGSRFRLHVRWSRGGGASSVEEVTALEPPAPDGGGGRRARLVYDFRGWMHALHLVRASRVQALEQAPGGPTRYATREDFRGLLTSFLPLADVRDGFVRHAEALRARAESLRPARP